MSFWTDVIEFSFESFQELWVKVSSGLAPGVGGRLGVRCQWVVGEKVFKFHHTELA